ncbi:AcvB/VirJ family lysyl-phosphatidylglycerol hydrolase [Chryseobacterium sp. SIMBA_029]|uniref:AcvB/VirJ family lysyl-phosphatidylglycerol hydrolase n=1 Tax=Chryseobacterium sp. SIMBA_029 TaxID=3085772 RepID=UPI00397A2ED9
MKNAVLFLLKLLPVAALLLLQACSSKNDFEISVWNSHTDKPIIFYISGDAGFNSFSKGLNNDFHTLGYDVFALNTKTYFWNKKTPKQTSAEIEWYINQQLNGRKNQKVILVGYSFGADVTPFVYNHFTGHLKKKIQHIFIIGPSKTTDFKIHLNEYFGMEPKGSMAVVPEINKIHTVPVTLILSNFEFLHFPYQQITLGSNYQMKHIQGNHHYSGNTKLLSGYIQKVLENKTAH